MIVVVVSQVFEQVCVPHHLSYVGVFGRVVVFDHIVLVVPGVIMDAVALAEARGPPSIRQL